MLAGAQRVQGGRTVVMGGGMAGLLAAWVLADHFEQVTLVERDGLTDSAQARKGVPQGGMLHTLMPRGLGIVERPQHRYLDRVMAAATQNPATADRYVQVIGMPARRRCSPPVFWPPR